MSSIAVRKFVDTILQHYPPYRWEDEQEQTWINTMVRELGGFSDAVLEKALSNMIRTRKDRKVPLVSECINACVDAKRWIERNERKDTLPIEEAGGAYADWTAERLKLATELACNPADPMCRQAAKEGWIGTLHQFVRVHKRMPGPPAGHPKEIEDCKRQAKEFDAAYAVCVRGDIPDSRSDQGMRPLAPLRVLEKLGAAMLERREEKINKVLQGAVR